MYSSLNSLSISWRKRIGSAVTCMLCCFITFEVNASALSGSFYTSASGDINGDGKSDVLVLAKAGTVIIPLDDFLIPLPLAPKSPTFLLQSNSNGNYSLIVNPGSSIISSGVWSRDSHVLTYGDVLGTGIGSMLIQANSQGLPSFVVATSSANGQPYLVQQLDKSNIGVDLSDPRIEASMSNQNSDARTDLVIRQDGLLSLVLLADSNGRFYRDDTSTIRAIWSQFLNLLSEGKTEEASKYFIVDSRDTYAAVFRELGSDVTSLPAELSNIRFIEVKPGLARLAITKTIEGQNRLYFLTFAFGEGGWRIYSL